MLGGVLPNDSLPNQVIYGCMLRRNPGPEWCRWIAVLIDADPAKVNGQPLKDEVYDYSPEFSRALGHYGSSAAQTET
jgi:hypothetical protein